MYLKSLTIRGFKSFASSTTLNFEPGITAVVGPNGSGKSNVVDAIAWVMGEQGAKSLRGGKMEDVIFSGSSGRAPLGRAEVLLTIDNTDGALPIEYAEVTISRTMFRNGGSEYAINGTPSRLLDIQELLSDSGIGREMHVIVGQNQLREILLATPEQRRGYIEEAAGVLKHRKRKEKALRKLEAMEVNLTRLEDLTNELRRQLKPLGRQAEVARRANVIQSDVRDARLRLLADDLTQMRQALEAEIADETALRERRNGVEEQLAKSQARETILDAQIAESAPLVEAAQNAYYQLGAQQERMRSTLALAKERVRLGEEESEEIQSGRDPEEIYHELTREFGEPADNLVEAPATPVQKGLLAKLSPEHVKFTELAGEKIQTVLTRAPGNGAPIGGVKVIAKNGWFAARPSGTENIYKIYAESFQGAGHLRRILDEAQTIVNDALTVSTQASSVSPEPKLGK